MFGGRGDRLRRFDVARSRPGGARVGAADLGCEGGACCCSRVERSPAGLLSVRRLRRSPVRLLELLGVAAIPSSRAARSGRRKPACHGDDDEQRGFVAPERLRHVLVQAAALFVWSAGRAVCSVRLRRKARRHTGRQSCAGSARRRDRGRSSGDRAWRRCPRLASARVTQERPRRRRMTNQVVAELRPSSARTPSVSRTPAQMPRQPTTSTYGGVAASSTIALSRSWSALRVGRRGQHSSKTTCAAWFSNRRLA